MLFFFQRTDPRFANIVSRSCHWRPFTFHTAFTTYLQNIRNYFNNKFPAQEMFVTRKPTIIPLGTKFPDVHIVKGDNDKLAFPLSVIVMHNPIKIGYMGINIYQQRTLIH